MKIFLSALLGLSLSLVGCVHRTVTGADLDRVVHPAFISRIEEGAGPRSEVFADDPAYREKLKKLEPREADRRLTVKLGQGVSRFAISEQLRAQTLALLPQEMPWTHLVNPAAVAKELQSFLVEEVPANAPDYDLLAPLGTDAVVEFVVERYGMRSRNGRAGVFAEGYGRMFMLSGRQEIWRRYFSVDQLEAELPHLDPFRVGKEPDLFRRQMVEILNAVAARFAQDLSPRERNPSSPAGKEEAPVAQPLPEQQPPPSELPEPDPI